MTQRPQSLRIAVGIATAGRSRVLLDTLGILEKQIRRPDRVVICAPSPTDVEGVADRFPAIETFFGARGSSVQRNVIIDRTENCDIVLFLDDDFILADDYLLTLENLHLTYRDVVMFTGGVLRDGVTTGGLSIAEALEAIASSRVPDQLELEVVYNGYGCNMSIRRDLVAREKIRFDENLPLYGWLEDVDFSRCLAPHGRIARAQALRGVHLGVKVGRQQGLRLGYSQIANPIYILRKGNFSLRRAIAQIGRNVSANILRCALPEPHIDRRGRMFGNFLALADLMKGRLSPSRILVL